MSKIVTANATISATDARRPWSEIEGEAKAYCLAALTAALARNGWSLKRTAAELQIATSSLASKVDYYGLRSLYDEHAPPTGPRPDLAKRRAKIEARAARLEAKAAAIRSRR